MPTFHDFRDGRMLRTLGKDISKMRSWREYTDVMVALPDIDDFLERVRERASACSSSQHAVLQAVLFGMDYAWLAAELEGQNFWERVGYFDRETATTVAAAIMRQDAEEQRAAA